MFDAITSSFTGANPYTIGGNDAYTKLLLHFGGADESTTITDSSASGHTVTTVANAQIDTAQKKFGTGSCLFDGTGDYLSIADHADWFMGTDEVTVDFWFRPDDVSGDVELFQQYTGGDDFISLKWNQARTHFAIKFRTGGATTLEESSDDYALQANTWYHFALIRGWGSGADDWAFCINGTEIGTFTDAVAWHDEGAAFEVGRVVAACYSGHIDEYRVSKGIARWTENFIPPNITYN